jgi:ABC-type transport system involved in multi-copper enzyme maturation permease subunit
MEDRLASPPGYEVHDMGGWIYLASRSWSSDEMFFQGWGLALVMLVALSGAFTREYSRKMSELVFAAALRRKLVWAKVLAALCLTGGAIVLLYSPVVAMIGGTYGFNNFWIPADRIFYLDSFSIAFPHAAYGMNVLISVGIFLLAVLAIALILLWISAICRNPLTALGMSILVMGGMVLFFSLFFAQGIKISGMPELKVVDENPLRSLPSYLSTRLEKNPMRILVDSFTHNQPTYAADGKNEPPLFGWVAAMQIVYGLLPLIFLPVTFTRNHRA